MFPPTTEFQFLAAFKIEILRPLSSLFFPFEPEFDSKMREIE
jgi:hypothetical protein